jgi:hypothetical protein
MDFVAATAAVIPGCSVTGANLSHYRGARPIETLAVGLCTQEDERADFQETKRTINATTEYSFSPER